MLSLYEDLLSLGDYFYYLGSFVLIYLYTHIYHTRGPVHNIWVGTGPNLTVEHPPRGP